MTKKTTSAKRSVSAPVKTSLITFLQFLRLKPQRNLFLLLFGIYLVGYFILLYLYPYPNGISDSGAYVLAAMKDKYDGYRPFGYSEFLQSIHSISSSYSVLVFVQYWLNAFATLYFVFTIRYFFEANNRILGILFWLFSVCSVTVIYLTNCVLSDSLFTSLTTLWITLGIWFIYRENLSSKVLIFIFHIVLLGFLMNVRHTGFFYSGISFLLVLIVFFKKNKLSALGFSVIPTILIIVTYNNQIQRTVENIGYETFSGFAGWQKANNALHVLPYVDLDLSEVENPDLKEFCTFAKQNDTIVKRLVPENGTTALFLWQKISPLKQFLISQIKKHKMGYVYAWTYYGSTVFDEFGSLVMSQHPVAYFTHFLIPNFMGVLYPSGDQLYNNFRPDAVPVVLRESWFEMDKDAKVAANTTVVIKISKWLPVFRLIFNLLTFAIFLVYPFISKRFSLNTTQRNIYWFAVLFVLGYLAFHTYTVPFELRYIAPVHLSQMLVIYLFINALVKKRPTDSRKTIAIP